MAESIDDILTRLNLWPPSSVELLAAVRAAIVGVPNACERHQSGDQRVVHILMGKIMQQYPGALPAKTLATIHQLLDSTDG